MKTKRIKIKNAARIVLRIKGKKSFDLAIPANAALSICEEKKKPRRAG